MTKFRTINLRQLKSKGAKALDRDTTSYLIVNSEVQYAITPIDEYEALIDALEELEDIKAIEERKDEEVIDKDEFFRSLTEENVQDSNQKIGKKRP